ncbi:MAG TPA: hypothetical protein DEH11_10225 [Actinobacteria bacterium]|nr:hypothetical protein [Actinomycetota bacterium]
MLAIVVLALWAVTAAAGVALLSAGTAARRMAASAPRTADAPVRTGAIPRTADGRPPPAPQAQFDARPGEHPLLEFSHPALAITGLACWFLFVFSRYAPLAWIAFGFLVVTLGAGLGWLARNSRAAARGGDTAPAFPPRLIMVHGAAAAVVLVLTVLTAVAASHG